MILLKYLVTLLILKQSLVSSSNVHLMKMVKDFLLFQRNPIKISSYTCWSSSDKVLLWQYLNKYRITFQQVNQTLLNAHQLQIDQFFLIDLRCPGGVNLLYEADKLMIFQQPYRWLVIMNDLMTLPNILDILVDSQFYLIKQLPDSTYNLRSAYKMSKYFDGFLENNIAIWSLDNGFVYYNALNTVRNRSDLGGIVLNISYVITNNDSLNHMWDYRDNHIDGISKLNYILIHHVTDSINASRNFIMRSTWGYKNQSTNMYDGLFGDLQSGLAELAGTAAFFTTDRVSIVDYIAPTTPTRAKFIFRAPPLSYVTNVFTLPFTEMVWFATFLLIGFISIIIYVTVKWEWSNSGFRNVLQEERNAMRPKYMDVLLMELGAICQQGSESEPKSVAGQITTIFMFITLMFMYISYSANIVALLQSTSDSIKTLDDLLNSRIKLGVEDKPYSYYYFKIQTEKTRKAIYTQKVAPTGQKANFMNVEVGINRMRDEFFAFHVECSSGYKVVADVFQESEKCGLREIEYWQIIDPWVAVTKNSSYKELTKIAFRKVHESGLQSREYRRLYTKKPVCQSSGNNFVSVGLIDSYYPFLIFGVGILISAGVLLIEILHRRNYRSK